jgi:hypothetical protein
MKAKFRVGQVVARHSENGGWEFDQIESIRVADEDYEESAWLTNAGFRIATRHLRAVTAAEIRKFDRWGKNLPQGCGAEKTRRLHAPVKSRVDITYFCTKCGGTKTVSVQWRSHHALPTGWKCRDIVPTNELPRRTDHIFSCSDVCRKALDIQYPPPKKPKWFATS